MKESEVAQVIDRILWPDLRIPVGDERFVHLLDGFEGSATVAVDILVIEMGVSGE